MKMHIDSGYTKDNTGNRVLMKGTKKMARDDRARHSSVRDRKQAKKAKRRRKRFIVICEVVVLLVLLVVAFVMAKLNKIKGEDFDENKLLMGADLTGYTNIALFGLDSREGEINGGVQSDCIMIASINNETDDVKLVSVYRDTLLQQADETYEKANSAYNRGGPEEAISLLNRNLDLDIQNYVSVNFNALVDTIDLLGGLEVELTAEEAFWCNGYSAETAQVVGQEMIPIKEEAGVQLLDGVHAVSYARIRYTEGDDFKRAERQRFILNETAKKAKKASFSTLNKILDKVFPQISTSFSANELLGFAANALNYNIVETTGFPFQVTTSENVMNHYGSYVVPIEFKQNVIELHKLLFGEEDYEPSETVQLINDEIIYLTGVTGESEALNTEFTRETTEEE